MPPLPNPRWEHVAKSYTDPKSPTFLNKTKSYKTGYPDANGSAEGSGSVLLSNPKVQERCTELMRAQGLTLQKFNEVHAGLLEDKDANIRFKSLRLGHELYGNVGLVKGGDTGTLAVQININVDSQTQ